MSENVIDRLRSLVVELDTRMPMASVALRLNKPEYKGIRETFVQVLGQLKESVEYLEAQSEGFSDKTRRHATTEPIDFTILSVNKMKTLTKKLESYYVSISNIPEYKGENANNTKVISQQSAIEKLERLFLMFHNIATSLRSRYSMRQTIEINDEHDVQDLFSVLMVLDFEDIRREEWTPSYAGGTARMDILLKREKVVIECKKPSKRLRERQVGEELLIDIARYKKHPDCKTLVCFIYDPDAVIHNRVELEEIKNESSEYFR